MERLTDEQLDALRAWPSPAISNAIETFGVRARNAGVMSPDIRCHFPELKPIVGHAVTCTIRASVPPDQDPEASVSRGEWYEHIESVPAPRIVVVKDLDQPPVGSFWGEVNANVHRALGCVGVVTDGGVRDMEEVRALGFQFLAKEVLVSHAFVHQVAVGVPVTVGGLTVKPGDLLHADLHGCIAVPRDIAAEVPAAAQLVEDRERVVIDYAQSPGFTREGLLERFRGGFTRPREEP